MGLRWYHAAFWGLFALGLLLLPQVASGGTLRTFIFANYVAIFAISWDVLSGRTGYIRWFQAPARITRMRPSGPCLRPLQVRAPCQHSPGLPPRPC